MTEQQSSISPQLIYLIRLGAKIEIISTEETKNEIKFGMIKYSTRIELETSACLMIGLYYLMASKFINIYNYKFINIILKMYIKV